MTARRVPRPIYFGFCWLVCCWLGILQAAPAAEGVESSAALLANHCYDCHTGEEAEAGLDLSQLGTELDDLATFASWERIHDRVRAGEMPPPDYSELDSEERQDFVEATRRRLVDHQQQQFERSGRVQGRRLTNKQLERTLHDLLGIDIPLANRLPDDAVTAGFTTVANGQAMSHFQLERHLAVVDAALTEAFRRATSPPDEWTRTLDAETLSRRNPRRRTREPELIDGRAVTWSSRLIFYGRLPSTRARQSGWYRFVIRGAALKVPDEHGVWCTVRSGRCVASAPLLSWLGAFELGEETREVCFEGWLPEGHMLEVRPGDSTLKLARFRGGQVGVGEGDPQDVPGIALESIEMSRIHRGADDEAIRELLFDNLVLDIENGASILSQDPHQDAERLLQRFARRAFRRPVDPTEVAPFVDFAQRALDDGTPLSEALRLGYRALLCSPRFLYFDESPGRLDAHAVANRLSYMLWGTMPDEHLFELAVSGSLLDASVFDDEVDRLLADPRSRRFVEDFAGEWLDLRLIDFTEPDRKLYPGFDVIVQQSMLGESHEFLSTLLADDLAVSHFIDSDFTFLNSRLARYYGMDGVGGDELQQVGLAEEDHRGGILTQGAVLKVTANGTTTSPVLRGVWVSERLLGEKIPPPPESVPAIEPDIRGATSIREMLAKHRADDACQVCHVKIDPAGFALENFDPSGRWREFYPRLRGRRRARGAEIDASYSLPDGRHFDNLDEFRDLILTNPERLARNFAEKLLIYGTGAEIEFADRSEVEAIVSRTAAGGYGVRSLLRASLASSIFLNK